MLLKFLFPGQGVGLPELDFSVYFVWFDEFVRLFLRAIIVRVDDGHEGFH